MPTASMMLDKRLNAFSTFLLYSILIELGSKYGKKKMEEASQLERKRQNCFYSQKFDYVEILQNIQKDCLLLSCRIQAQYTKVFSQSKIGRVFKTPFVIALLGVNMRKKM
jgi:hypothetical protein